MSSIIPFLDESEAVFDNEEIISARNTIVEKLNDFSTANPNQKVELIVMIQEKVLQWAPAMKVLEEFIDDIMRFSMDSNVDVKKTVAGFIEEVCKKKIRMLPKVISGLSILLRDDSALVKKRVIQGFTSIYRNTLQWVCSSEDVTDELERCWDNLCYIKAQILDMIDDDNDGIRTNSIKFLEGVIILQTHPVEDSIKRDNEFSLDDVPLTLKIVRRRKLEEEALKFFEILLKFHGASHISSVNLIACTGTLCTIAKLRPTFMNAVIEALKSLHSNLPPTLTNSQVSSVRKNLKMQFMNLLKHPASFEMKSTVISILNDLGSTQIEINRAIPKMDKKEIQRRTKRALENDITLHSHIKKAKMFCEENVDVCEKSTKKMMYETDYSQKEIEEKYKHAIRINETFLIDALKSIEVAVEIVLSVQDHLPEQCPESFISKYKPVSDITIDQQIENIAQSFAPLLTSIGLGPGSIEFPIELKDFNASKSIGSMKKIEFFQESGKSSDDKDETTIKLRQTLLRVQNNQNPRVKQRIKNLKLQEITKPLNLDLKTQFLRASVLRILKCEHQAIVSGVGFKRKKIITVFASTFMPSVRTLVMEYIFDDIVKRFDLMFMWIFEEYSLLQGFTRHSYVKTEHKHDYAYNLLLTELISKILDIGSAFRARESLVKRIYLEAPLLTEDSFKILFDICEREELAESSLELIKDLLIRRPPKEEVLLQILLKRSLHKNNLIREKAVQNVLCIYSMHKIMTEQIEVFAMKWLNYLLFPSPNEDMLNMLAIEKLVVDLEETNNWTEDLVNMCLNLFSSLVPFNHNLIHSLSEVYICATPDVKKMMLGSIEHSVRDLGMMSEQLLNLIESCEQGSETLITRIIYILTENVQPTKELVDKVCILYLTKLNDVRILVPILNSLTKKEVITALPKFLKLSSQLMKDVFSRLLSQRTSSPITPVELLVALHQQDKSKVELKSIVLATSICMSEKEIYTQEVLGVVIQQLIDIVPLPTLLMRTVIQSLTQCPRLSGFVLNILDRLILKQVWKQKVIWEGFLKCCQRLQPQSMVVLMKLPIATLQDALYVCPELRSPLLEYAKDISATQMGHVSQQHMELLMGGKSNRYLQKEVFPSNTESNVNESVSDLIKLEAEEPVPSKEHLPPGTF
ncbi:unnamed protein product [Diamesa serratosioi]